MEAKRIPQYESVEPLQDPIRELTETEITDFVDKFGAHNDRPLEVEAQEREYAKAKNRRLIETSKGDEVITRSVIIPTRAQIKAGMKKKPHSIEENDLEYLKNKFPIGSEINIDLGHKEVRACVLDVNKNSEGIYFRVFFIDDFGGLKWSDENIKNLITTNKKASDIQKVVLDERQIKNILLRIDSGEIKKSDHKF